MQRLGLLDVDISIQSTMPASVVAGLYFERTQASSRGCGGPHAADRLPDEVGYPTGGAGRRCRVTN